MTSAQLALALEQYHNGLTTLENSVPNFSNQAILEVLAARDVIHRTLSDENQTIPTGEQLNRLLEIDSRLEELAQPIAQVVHMADWRKRLSPPPEAWWWILDKRLSPHWASRLDWLWAALTVTFLTISLGLTVDIARRFLSGGPDVYSALAAIFPAVISLFAAGGALTKAGQTALDKSLKRLPDFIREGARLMVALVVLIVVGLFWFQLPRIAIIYNNTGVRTFVRGDLTTAQYNYLRAINLDPDYHEAHYNLGLLYEDLFDFEAAKREYKLALQGGLVPAYNNLARLFILEEDYAPAASLLLNGLKLADDDEVAYDMHKNLGWARLGQERYAEAKVYLNEAIAIKQDRAPAYCLLAQVLEAQKDIEGARTAWEKCVAYADVTQQDEDNWVGMAHKELEALGDK